MYDDIRHLADENGIILRTDLLAVGGNDDTIRRLRAAKVIVRVRQGAYAIAGVWEARNREERHLLLAKLAYHFSRTDIVLSHLSAAVIHGAPTWDLCLDEVHLTRLDRKAGRRQTGIVQHRGKLPESDVVVIDGHRVTTPTRTALDLTTVLDLEHSVPILDHFLHAGRTSPDSLNKGAKAMRMWANTLGTELAVLFADGRRESVGESRTALMFRGSLIPQPEPQYEITDDAGHVFARVDFAWPELGVFLEFDGKVKYQKFLKDGEDVVDVVLREKKREERICRLTGWRCIRITWADLHRPQETLRYITSVLGGGPIHR